MASKNSKSDLKIKYKNVQFWVSDLFKAFDEENPKNNDWISSVGNVLQRLLTSFSQ